MRRLPPLNALRAFEAAARLSSITGAAAELGVSHSAVSQQVKLLEDYFGETLFARRGRRIEPTPAARALLEDVGSAFDHMAVASERLSRRGGRRVVSVNAPASFALQWLIPRIAAFEREHPGLELRVATCDVQDVAQLDRPYDAIIRRDVMKRRGCLCRRLLDDDVVPLVNPRLLERREVTRPAHLSAHTLLHARSRPDAWRRWFQAHGVAAPEPSNGPSFDNTALALHGALIGLGAALAPLALVAEDLAEGRLVAPFPAAVLAGPGYHVLYREAAIDERGPRELLKWLIAQAGGRVALAGARSLSAASASTQGRA